MLDRRVEDLFKKGRVNEARVLSGMLGQKFDEGFYSNESAQQRFTHQNDYGPHRAFDETSSWREYFLYHDGLHNLYDDVVFSILDRYLCRFGCKTCYLNGVWMEDGEFAPYIPDKLTDSTIDQYLDIFKHFYRVGSIDDLTLIKKRGPHLYEFFKNYAHLMEHNMTDHAFFKQFPLLMKECSFDKTAYLSFSDHVLNRLDGKLVERIIPMIRDLHEVSPIRKLNFILAEGYATENKIIMKLFDWVVSNTDIETFFHTDLCQDRDFVADLKAKYDYDLPSIYYQENSVNPPIVCQILTETIQMRGKSMFSTLTGSTMNVDGDERITKPFYRFDETFEIEPFLAGVLQSKVDTYDYYQSKMTIREENRFFEYFSWVKDNVKINTDFTFVPLPLLKPYSIMGKKLLEKGFINTHAGYLKKGATNVKSIVEINS